jgi:hypothetical protein
MATIRQIIRDAAANNYKVQSFVQGIVASQAFRMSRIDAPETTTAAPAARH